MADLDNLDTLASDIHNAFLEHPTKEKILFFAGDEWKYDKEKVVIFVRSLYGLNFLALQFRNFLAETLGNRRSYKKSLTEPDIWYKPMTDADGFEYYSYILVYVYNILLIMKYTKESMAQIQDTFTVKIYSIEKPKSYLRADINKIYCSDGSYGWNMGAETYVNHSIKNLNKQMSTEGFE